MSGLPLLRCRISPLSFYEHGRDEPFKKTLILLRAGPAQTQIYRFREDDFAVKNPFGRKQNVVFIITLRGDHFLLSLERGVGMQPFNIKH
jgi:hypothetical protein